MSRGYERYINKVIIIIIINLPCSPLRTWEVGRFVSYVFSIWPPSRCSFIASCTFFNSFEISSSFSFNLSFSTFNIWTVFFLVFTLSYSKCINFCTKLKSFGSWVRSIRLRAHHLSQGFGEKPGERVRYLRIAWHRLCYLPRLGLFKFCHVRFSSFDGCFVVTRDSTDLTVLETTIDWYKHTTSN